MTDIHTIARSVVDSYLSRARDADPMLMQEIADEDLTDEQCDEVTVRVRDLVADLCGHLDAER